MWEALNIAIKLHIIVTLSFYLNLGKEMIVLSGVGEWILGRSYISED